MNLESDVHSLHAQSVITPMGTSDAPSAFTEDLASRAVESLERLSRQSASFWDVIAALAPWAAFLAAAFLAVIAWKNLKHQRASDARSEWWRRTQWALESSVSGDPKMERLGAEVLKSLAASELTNPEDKKLLDSVWQESATRMDDAKIIQLISDYQRQADGAAKTSTGNLDLPLDSSDNEVEPAKGEEDGNHKNLQSE